MILEQTQPEPINITKVYIPESALPKNILNNDNNKSTLFRKITVKKFGLLFNEKKEPVYDYFPSQKVLTTQKIIVDVFCDEDKVNKIRQEYFDVATEIAEVQEKKQVEGEYNDFDYEYEGIINLDCLSDCKKIDYVFPSGDKVIFKSLGTMTNGMLNVYVV